MTEVSRETELQNQLHDLHDVHNVALAKLAIAEAALEELSTLGNGGRQGNSIGNVLAQEALRGMQECQPSE